MGAEALPTEPCFLRSERSAAFTRFCERVYGRMLNQYGTADMEQLALLLRVLDLRADRHVLDAGCGTGQTTRYLADQSGAAFTGIDKSASAIRRADEHTAASPRERLTFLVGDMDALDLPPASFDAIVAIESLYFPNDLVATVARFKRVLRPQGRMGLFFTHFGDGTTAADPAATKLGQALLTNHLVFETHDLTEADRGFWHRCAAAAEALRADFDVEGNADLLHEGETAAVLDLISKGGHARYLYDVRV